MYKNIQLLSRLNSTLAKSKTSSIHLRIPISNTISGEQESNLTSSPENESLSKAQGENKENAVHDSIERFCTVEDAEIAVGDHIVVEDVGIISSKLYKRVSEKFIPRYTKLAQYLTGKRNSHILPYKIISHLPKTPYERFSEIDSPATLPPYSILNNSRLSVTKIVSRNYCELQNVFRLYEGHTELEATPAMERGKMQHLKYERKTHPVKKVEIRGSKPISVDESILFSNKKENEINKIRDVIKMYDIKLLELINSEKRSPNLKVEKKALEFGQTILRLLMLFQFGHCREIISPTLYDIKDKKILTGFPDKSNENLNPNDYIIISGIIDHLTLESTHQGVFEEYQKELKQKLTSEYDISLIFQAVENASKVWCDRNDPLLYLTVKDVKTRYFPKLPPEHTQERSLVQVGMYRYFLEILSNNCHFTFETLRVNLMKRGFDPHTVLPQSIVMKLLVNNSYFYKDFSRLKKGEQLGLQIFDEMYKDYKGEKFTFDYNVNGLQGEWKIPPTFDFLIARLSQMYGLINNFFSDKLYIEYSFEQAIFKEIGGIYDTNLIQNEIKDGVKLWFGLREPAPPTYKSLCAKCNYRYQCGWNLKNQCVQH